MQLEITQQNENALFKRKEVQAIAKANSIPSKEEVKKVLSEKLSSPEEGIRIMYIKGKFGIKEFEISAHVYASKQDRDATEKMSKKEKEAEKKAEEAKAVPEENTSQEQSANEEPKPEEAKKETSEAPQEKSNEETKSQESKE